MQDQLFHALVHSKNEAADDVLVEALRLGDAQEKRPILDALLERKSVHGLCGAVREYDRLPEILQRLMLAEIKLFHSALREAGRSEDVKLRLAALRLIALGRQGKLAYVLSENLHDSNEQLSKAATEAMVALARWISIETRKLQKGLVAQPVNPDDQLPFPVQEQEPRQNDAEPDPSQIYSELMSQRPEIEAAVARALDVHRGRHGQDLLRAALLLCDWPGSKTLAILHTAKHGGQSPMVRRLQQPPASEHVEAFLLGATHGQLRSHFGIVFSHISEAPVLDALLRKTHWLRDHQLQLCMHQVTRGAWWNPGELIRDVDRRTPEDAARVGEWIAASGAHDVVQDERLEKLLSHCLESFEGRLRLLRIAARRKRGSSVQFFRVMLSDPDERLMRMAAREIIRRRPTDFENMLLQLMTNAPESVRKVVSRSIGQVGFDQFWMRFDRLDRTTRKHAGKAMIKLLPDAVTRLRRRICAGAPDQRIKAMQIAQELGLADDMRDAIVAMCSDSNPRLRSKAVSVLGEVKSVPADVVIERLVTDTDPRVRANAIEVMENRPQQRLLPVLAQRALTNNNRERANAIKALHKMKVGTAAVQLLHMLRDQRPEHRISALWTLKQIGWWQLMNEVGRLAKDDNNLKVRRYALGVLKNVAELAQPTSQGKGSRLNMIRSIHMLLAMALISLAVLSSVALATPTQQDVFKSIQENVSQTDESSARAVPWICGGVALIIVLAFFGKRQSRQATPKTVNNPGKLIKEVMKAIPLKPRELKQLKIVADQTQNEDGEPLTNPLVLLLCPSVVIKAVNERSTRADRQTLVTVLKKMGIR